MKRSRLFGYLSSWWTTAGLVLSGAIAYVVCLFGTSPYTDWTGFLLHRPAGLFLYCALMLNMLLASMRVAAKKLSCPDMTLPAIQAMDVYTAFPANPFYSINRLAATMEHKGFTVTQAGSSVCAKMNRYSFLPGTILRFGIIVLLAAMLVSVHTRKSSETILHEGDTLGPPGTQVTAESLSSDLPNKFLQVGQESTFRLNRVSALLKSSDRADTVTAGFPVSIGGKYYRVTHFGFTLPVMIKVGSGTIQKNLDLDILPPGKTHSVQLQPNDLIVTFSLQPERIITKGLLKGKEYDLRNPSYHIVLQNGPEKKTIGEFTMKEEVPATVSSTAIALGKHSFYAKVRAVSDPALPLIYGGTFLTLFGMLLICSRFFWYEKELLAVQEKDTLHVGYREEFFRKWGAQKFHDWMINLSA